MRDRGSHPTGPREGAAPRTLTTWTKTVGGMAQIMYRGIERVRARFTLTMAACNLARLPKLLAA